MNEKRRPRVAILAPIHRYSDTRVFQKQAVSLAAAGYDVHLFARAHGVFVEKGVQVHGLPSTSRLRRFLRLPILLVRSLLMRADVYHLHNPDTIPIALGLKLFGRRVIYDTHEDFAQRILVRDWIPTKMRRAIAWAVSTLESTLTHKLNGVIVTQPNIARRMHGPTKTILNLPRVSDEISSRVELLASKIERGDEFRLIYAGVLTPHRGLQTAIDSLELLNRSNTRRIRLWLLGEGERTLESLRGRPGFKFVDFLGLRTQEEAFAYISRSDVGLIVIDDVADHRFTSPNKLFEYLMFGIPAVSSDFTAWREALGSAEDCVFYVPPKSPDRLAAAVTELMLDDTRRLAMGRRGKDVIYRQLNWTSEEHKLLDLYAKILRDGELRV